jgi:hypothetical protein
MVHKSELKKLLKKKKGWEYRSMESTRPRVLTLSTKNSTKTNTSENAR